MTSKNHIEPEDFPIFGEWSFDTYYPRRDDFLRLFKDISEELGVDWDSVEVNENSVFDIIDMVQKRRVYFHVYHNGMEMGELNEACLICFWVLKLSPFCCTTDYDYNLNLLYALGLFTRAVNYEAKRKKEEPKMTRDVVLHLKHTFSRRDLSKEAIMAIARCMVG